MIKLFKISTAAVAIAMVAPAAFAQGAAPSTELPRVPGQIPAAAQPGGDGVAVNGRCGGVSTGTGARRCGDQTGGPADGLDNRN